MSGRAVSLPWTSRGRWFANGRKAPIRSKSFPDAAPRIAFDEIPVGTAVSDQYRSQGALFAGSPGPVIANDGSSPTPPVLSPGPGYSGSIDITFVNPCRGSKAAGSTAPLKRL